MKFEVNFPIARYVDTKSFSKLLGELKAGFVFGRALGPIEGLHRAGLLYPKVRMFFPPPIVRRLWIERYNFERTLNEPVEVDGSNWSRVVSLKDRLIRFQNPAVYGLAEHPFDDSNSNYQDFVHKGSKIPYLDRAQRSVSIGNPERPNLSSDEGVTDYFSSWQLLEAAEMLQSGFFVLANLVDEVQSSHAMDRVFRRERIEGDVSWSMSSFHAAKAFRQHEPALDAAVWSREEADRNKLLRLLNLETRSRYIPNCVLRELRADQKRHSQSAIDRFHLNRADIVACLRFLCERYVDWEREGRPFTANAYKKIAALVFNLIADGIEAEFAEIATDVSGPDSFQPCLLKHLWPQWTDEQKESLLLTLQVANIEVGPYKVSSAEIAEFSDFLVRQGKDAFLLRFDSFHRNVFGDSVRPVSGMRSDLQGMAIAIEHLLREMGADGIVSNNDFKLLEMYQNMWRDKPGIVGILKSHAQSVSSNITRLDWSRHLSQLKSISNESDDGRIAFDLLLTHRIRGAVHFELPETDLFEIEQLFVAMIRGAAVTFAHLKRNGRLRY